MHLMPDRPLRLEALLRRECVLLHELSPQRLEQYTELLDKHQLKEEKRERSHILVNPYNNRMQYISAPVL